MCKVLTVFCNWYPIQYFFRDQHKSSIGISLGSISYYNQIQIAINKSQRSVLACKSCHPCSVDFYKHVWNTCDSSISLAVNSGWLSASQQGQVGSLCRVCMFSPYPCGSTTLPIKTCTIGSPPILGLVRVCLWMWNNRWKYPSSHKCSHSWTQLKTNLSRSHEPVCFG